MQPPEIPAAEPVLDGFDPAVSRAQEIVNHVYDQLDYILRIVLGSPQTQNEKMVVKFLASLRADAEAYFANERQVNAPTADVKQILGGITRKVGEP